MKYTEEERLDIGRRVYNREFTYSTAAVEFGLHPSTVRDYVTYYRHKHNLPARKREKSIRNEPSSYSIQYDSSDYESMSKEELITELIRSKIRESRLKKGYEVKGDGAEKEYIVYDSKNTK